MGSTEDRMRPQWSLLIVVLSVAVGVPTEVAADSLSDYKATKHGNSAGSVASSDDSDEVDDSGGWLGEIVSEIADGADDRDRRRESSRSSTETSLSADAGRSSVQRAQACRFERFYQCLEGCPSTSTACRQQCRRQADWICGTSSRSPSAEQLSARRGRGAAVRPLKTPDGFSGEIEGGVGGVEGGWMLTTQTRMRWGRFGFGHHLSWMGNEVDDLVETDLGPAVFTQSGGFRGGIQPSLMVSFGNAVQTRLGGGVRWYAGWRGRRILLSLTPMTGVIHGRFNLQMRSAAGLRLGSRFYLKGGHDYRYVRNLANGQWSGMHGGFLSFGLRLP